LEWPGATTVADSKQWQFSILPLERLRVRQFGQPSFREQKYSVPSQAISVLPPSRPKVCRMGGSASRVSICSKQGCSSAGSASSSTPRMGIVAGNSADPEQGLAVGAAMPLLQPALVGEKRRALREEHRERRQPEIGDVDIAGAPLAEVRKSRASIRRAGKEGW